MIFCYIFIPPTDLIINSSTSRYFHVYQKATIGDGYNVWLMEGGAVLFECVMSNAVSIDEVAHPVLKGSNLASGFRECIKNKLTDYTGTLPTKTADNVDNALRAIQLIQSPSCRTVFDHYSDFRMGPRGGGTVLSQYIAENVDQATDEYPDGTSKYTWVYEGGLLATIFAMHRSNRTSGQFKHMITSGLYANVQFEQELLNSRDWHYTVKRKFPGNYGWRKALSKYTGYNDIYEFFLGFDEWIKSIETIDDVLGVMESDESIEQTMRETLGWKTGQYAKTHKNYASEVVNPDCDTAQVALDLTSDMHYCEGRTAPPALDADAIAAAAAAAAATAAARNNTGLYIAIMIVLIVSGAAFAAAGVTVLRHINHKEHVRGQLKGKVNQHEHNALRDELRSSVKRLEDIETNHAHLRDSMVSAMRASARLSHQVTEMERT